MLDAHAVRPHTPGVGRAAAHHGEILQGVFADARGRLHRGLITLPCALFAATARFHLTAEVGVRCAPEWKCKARRAAELALAHCASESGGALEISSNVPVGHGLGSSTSDVIAAIHAVFHALQRRATPATVAEIAVHAERASDSTMFEDRAVLFAQREGVVLEDFGRPLPQVHVLGTCSDPDAAVDTLATPAARYEPYQIDEFRRLLSLTRTAIRDQRPALLGQVATASARINQRHLPKPKFDAIERIAELTGALGIQVAHSGTVLGLLYGPEAFASTPERIDDAEQRLRAAGLHHTWRFAAPL